MLDTLETISVDAFAGEEYDVDIRTDATILAVVLDHLQLKIHIVYDSTIDGFTKHTIRVHRVDTPGVPDWEKWNYLTTLSGPSFPEAHILEKFAATP